ncbi:hypothetical protein BC835DRAFT_178563 [Cytidiella melzeri]|nr:hypothetical protein BC835DRAFT_178563 [Cytidiella melzeri]
MAQFSRLQLAKALIEYDNEYLPPEQPRKVAEESAIFRALRRNLPSRQPLQQRNTDFLGVSLPSETDFNHGGRRSMTNGESTLDSAYRKSIASVDNLRNPFGRDSTIEGGSTGEEIEVDLASWGLDAFDEKTKKKGKRLQRQESDAASVLPNPHPPLQNSPVRTRPPMSTRTMSMGNIPFLTSSSRDDMDLGAGDAFPDARTSISPAPSSNTRRYSIGTALDFPNIQPSDPALMQHRRKSSGHALIDGIPTAPPLFGVPFPTALGEEDDGGLAYDAPDGAVNSNPFSVRPPSPDRASRFDPKSRRSRVISNASLGTMMLGDDSPRPEDSISMISPKPGRDRPYSRLELMRPKVLVMPSPLQGSAPTTPAVPQEGRDGFQITQDGPPLPAAARSNARNSVMDLLSPPLSNSSTGGGGYFTPNPRASLTLSQLTFRNSLMVDGQRDVAYTDIDERLQRAKEEGEQVQVPDVQSIHPQMPTLEVTDADEFEQMKKDRRPAGKLYGKSLIDDLEARKAEMKGKQR